MTARAEESIPDRLKRNSQHSTVAKDLQVFYGGAKKGDWDVGLCMDVVRMIPKIDAMVLVSGDGDYADLLSYAKSQGLRAEVIAFGKTCSSRLVEAADEVIDMSESPRKYLIRSGRSRSAPKDAAEN